MKTSAKQLNNVGLLLVFLACLSFGYAIAKQILGRETFEIALIVSGITCLLFAISAFRLAKKKKMKKINLKNRKILLKNLRVVYDNQLNY